MRYGYNIEYQYLMAFLVLGAFVRGVIKVHASIERDVSKVHWVAIEQILVLATVWFLGDLAWQIYIFMGGTGPVRVGGHNGFA